MRLTKTKLRQIIKEELTTIGESGDEPRVQSSYHREIAEEIYADLAPHLRDPRDPRAADNYYGAIDAVGEENFMKELTRASDSASRGGYGSATSQDADRILLKMLIAHVAGASPRSK